MKKILILSVLIAAFCFSAFAQETTPTSSESEDARIRLVAALERAQTEVKASRKLIDALHEHIQSKEKRIDVLNKKDEASAAAIAGLQSELKNLRSAITEAEAALKIQQAEVVELKKQRDSVRKKLRRARSLTKYLAVAAAVLGAIVVIK